MDNIVTYFQLKSSLLFFFMLLQFGITVAFFTVWEEPGGPEICFSRNVLKSFFFFLEITRYFQLKEPHMNEAS